MTDDDRRPSPPLDDSVLVVEDDERTARMLGEMLEALGHRVAATVPTAAEALEASERVRPGLVMMDIRLAGPADGVEAAREIRARRDVPVIYVTAHSDAETLDRAVETNPYGYLTKPVDLRALESAVKLALLRHRMETRLRKKEERFRLLIENAEDIITVVTPTGVIEYESPAVESVLGYGPEERIGRDAFTFIHPDDRDEARRRFSKVLDEPGRPLSAELRVRSRDGELRHLAVTGQAYRDADGDLRVVVNSRDRTEARRAETALRASEERFRALFERNVAGVFRHTMDGTILEVNQAFASIFGLEDPGELVGRSMWELCRPDEDAREPSRSPSRRGEQVNRVLRLTRDDDSVRWLLENSVPVDDPARNAPVVIGTVVDITERKRLGSEFERLAHHDPLTRLANRRLLADRARQMLALAERDGQHVAIVYLDLDRFKSINDNLGHEAGDRILVEVAYRLRSATRESDTVARVGGDEFAVLLPNVEGVEGGVRAARRIDERLGKPMTVDDRSLQVGAQLGVAVYPQHGRDFEGLLRAADQAMYRKKNVQRQDRGGSERGHGVAVADDVPPVGEFSRAIEEDQLRLHYQPIHDLRAGRVAGREALARWMHPTRGLLVASDFLPSVEDPSLLRRLDRWVLERVARRLRSREGRDAPWLSLNLTASSLQDDGLMERLGEAVRGPGRRGSLVVEITEHTAVMDPEATFDRLSRLRDLGLRVALDDFGTGHSSLAHLRNLPVDLLKLDRIFLEKVDSDRSSGRVARGIFELGRVAGMTVVAEGVEREGQLAWVRQNGCEMVQGHYLGKPAPLPPLEDDGRPES